MIDRHSRRWKRARATVELCERRRRRHDGTKITPRDRYRYAITISYPVEGDLYLTDVVSNKPLKEGSRVTVQYDPVEYPRPDDCSEIVGGFLKFGHILAGQEQ